MSDNSDVFRDLARYTGETVTIYTTSGGESGCGFTGVLLAVSDRYVRLVTQIGPAPGCSLGNACSGFGGGRRGFGSGGYYSPGSVTVIPIDRIASFVHNAI